MEHIFFEVQLCIKISIFKEKHVFDILIILCLGTSLKVKIPSEPAKLAEAIVGGTGPALPKVELKGRSQRSN